MRLCTTRPVRSLVPAVLGTALALGALPAALARADIISNGAITPAPQPIPNPILKLQGNFQIYYFQEQTVKLPNALAVDITAPGPYQKAGDLTPGMIAANTTVNSYFFQFYPAPTPGLDVIWKSTGSIFFPQKILGIIVDDDHLDKSDPVVGLPGEKYPTRTVSRGLDLVPGNPGADVLLAGADMMSLSLDLKENSRFLNGFDELRVITAVPEPSVPTLCLIAAACGVVAAHRRRRRLATEPGVSQ